MATKAEEDKDAQRLREHLLLPLVVPPSRPRETRAAVKVQLQLWRLAMMMMIAMKVMAVPLLVDSERKVRQGRLARLKHLRRPNVLGDKTPLNGFHTSLEKGAVGFAHPYHSFLAHCTLSFRIHHSIETTFVTCYASVDRQRRISHVGLMRSDCLDP